MTVWLVNPFWDLPQEGSRPQRYWLMARAFAAAGHRVVYWTSDFSHATKRKRALRCTEVSASGYEADGVRVVPLPTKPYPRNVCLSRLLSHRALARTFAAFARRETDLPGLVVASVPPLGLCDAARRFAKGCGAKFVCDVQDAWPETFERIVPRFLLAGPRRTARRIYRGADAVTATGRAYLELAARHGAFAPMRVFGQAIGMGPSPARPSEGGRGLRLVYCGNMSLSYDLETAIRAVRDLPDATFDLAGDGPDRARLENLASGCARIRFHGYLGEAELADLLASGTVGIVPMFPESRVTVPGKLADYAAAGLRVVECLGGECAEITDRFGVGAHYAPRDAESLKAALKTVGTLSPDRDGFRGAFDGARMMAEFARFAEGLFRAPKRIVHVAGEWSPTNGVSVLADRIAAERTGAANAAAIRRRIPAWREFRAATEVWVHGGWLPCLWRAVLAAKSARCPVVKRMPHGSYSPAYLKHHGWKKRLAGPVERFCLRRCSSLVATCAAEADWIRAYVGGKCPPIEILDPKRFFDLSAPPAPRENPDELHVLYLGRPHPLKGVAHLEAAAREAGARVKLRIVSDAVGEEKERVWAWCDVLVLPTLSDNFGLVVAEALERGKRVVTTDGAPAWKGDPRVTFLDGFRDGTPERRIALLKDALGRNAIS